MKTRLLLGLLCIAAFTQKIYAAEFFRDPYIGIQAMQTDQKFENSYKARELFHKNPQDYALMAGFKFNSNFGVELGFGIQPKKTKQHFFLPGQVDSSYFVVTDRQTISVESSYITKYSYLGFFADYVTHINMGAGKLKAEAMIGLAPTKVTATSKINDTNRFVVATTITKKNYSKKGLVPILRLSALADLTPRLSCGVFLHYKKMSKFEFISQESVPETYTIKMKNALGVGLSLKVYMQPRAATAF